MGGGGGEIRQIQDHYHWNCRTKKWLSVERSWKLESSRNNNILKYDVGLRVKPSADSLFDSFRRISFCRVPFFQQVSMQSSEFYDEFSR